MITELLNRNNDWPRCHRNHPKINVIHKLAELHEREMRELKELKMIKLKSMEQCEKDCEKRVERIDNKIRVLENELKNLAKDKVKRTNQHSLELLGLEEDLKRLESGIVVEEGMGQHDPQWKATQRLGDGVGEGVRRSEADTSEVPAQGISYRVGRLLLETKKQKRTQLLRSSYGTKNASFNHDFTM